MSVAHPYGYVLAAVGAALFSTKAIFIKLAYADKLDATLFLSYRMIFALPAFVAVGTWLWLKRARAGTPPPEPRTVLNAIATGILGYYIASYCDFAGLLYITASLERLVLFTYPLFVMFIGAAAYNEPIPPFGIGAAIVTYVGLAIVLATDIPTGGIETIIGTGFVLGAALSFAWHQILAKRLIGALGSMLYTSIALSAAGVACILHHAIFSGADFSAPPRFLWLAAGCAIISTVIPTFMINAGLARISPPAVAMISTLSPLVTIGLAVAILGETFTFTDALGATLVLVGIGLYTWGDLRRIRAGTQQT